MKDAAREVSVDHGLPAVVDVEDLLDVLTGDEDRRERVGRSE